MVLREVGCGDKRWMKLVQDRVGGVNFRVHLLKL
jgi:hypothetical protein